MAPPYVNSGIGSQLIMAPETAYGTVPAALAAGAVPYEFTSETLELKKTTVVGQGLHGGGLHSRGARRVLTNYAVAGGITMDLPTRYLNTLLFQMFGSKGQPAATLTQDATTGAYSAVHQPGSMFGQSMAIQKGVPAVDGTAPLPVTEVGCKMTDWQVAIATGQIGQLVTNWDGRNELAGASTHGDPLNASVAPLGIFSEAATNNVFHFRQATLYTGGSIGVSPFGSALASPPAVPATTVQVQNPYAFLAAVTIAGGTLTQVLVNGVQVGTAAGTYAVPPFGTIAITYSVAPTWTWFAGVTTVTGAVAAGNVKSAEVKYGFHLDVNRYFLGSNGFKGEQVEEGFRDITGQFVVEWLNSHAMYDSFASDTPTTLKLDFQGPVIGSGTDHSALTLLVPQIFLDGESPKVGGPQVVTQTVPFTGYEDGTNAPIQATYWTLDSA